MVNAQMINARLDDGYAKAAAVLGLPYQQYRAAGPNNPMLTPMETLNVWATTDAGLKGTTPMLFGKPQWFAAMERDNLQMGDYISGALGVFFVLGLDVSAPVGLIYCNRTISIARAQDVLQPGENAQRFGIAVQAATDFMVGWPASVLQLGSKMGSTGMNLPSDAKAPSVEILLPACVPQIRFNDIVTDDNGQRYMVSTVEQSAPGWRLTGELQPAG